MDSDEIPIRTFAEGYGDDPPASMLTHAQREYFFGMREVEGGSERALKQRVRRRIEAALWDLSLLVRRYPEEELDKIRPDDGGYSLPTPALASFLYRIQPENAGVAEDLIEDADSSTRDRRAAWVESDVSRGIKQAIRHREDVDATVETSITVNRGTDLNALAEKELSLLTRDQLDILLVTGRISDQEYAEANRDRISRDLDG